MEILKKTELGALMECKGCGGFIVRVRKQDVLRQTEFRVHFRCPNCGRELSLPKPVKISDR